MIIKKDKMLEYLGSNNNFIVGVSTFSGEIFNESELKTEIEKSTHISYDKDISMLEIDSSRYVLYKLCELN